MKKFGLFFLSIAVIYLAFFNPWVGCSTLGDKTTNTQSTEKASKESRSKTPEHHTENGFQNYPYVETTSSPGIFFFLRRFWHSIFLHDVPDNHFLSASEAIELRNSISGDSVTWLGHATFLIRISGKTILTDPFLSEFASPSQWGGPTRMLAPGIPLDNLPPIDIIIVSHNHYDHLDDETIRKIPDKEKIQVIVPLGLKPFFKERGYLTISELDWHDDITIHEIEFTSLPAVHNSGRSLRDRNKTLWASWAITSPEIKLFFIGDSAYSDTIFKKIGDKHGPFNYVFLPIGAYEPRERMKTHHMNPEEAVTAAKEVHAKTLIASHWGTINLSDEPPWEPPERFFKACIDNGMKKKKIWVLKTGETRPLEKSPHRSGVGCWGRRSGHLRIKSSFLGGCIPNI